MSQENRYDAAASGVIASGERGGASLKEKLFGNLVKNLCERVQSKRGKLKGASFMRKKSPEELEYAKIAGKIGILFFVLKCGEHRAVNIALERDNCFGQLGRGNPFPIGKFRLICVNIDVRIFT